MTCNAIILHTAYDCYAGEIKYRSTLIGNYIYVLPFPLQTSKRESTKCNISFIFVSWQFLYILKIGSFLWSFVMRGEPVWTAELLWFFWSDHVIPKLGKPEQVWLTLVKPRLPWLDDRTPSFRTCRLWYNGLPNWINTTGVTPPVEISMQFWYKLLFFSYTDLLKRNRNRGSK